MGRNSTGAWTVYESMRLDLSYLIKHKFIVRGSSTSGQLNWNLNGKFTGSIGIYCSYRGTGKNYVRLVYTTTYKNGDKKDFHYKIELIEKPSNLGKGNVLYMRCPETGRLGRIFYKAYGSDTFKSREAYKQNHNVRLYYDCQKASKIWRYNECYWRIERHMENMSKWRKSYKGQETRSYKRVKWLLKKQDAMEYERTCGKGVPYAVKKMLPEYWQL